jgi:hypothetical protein
MNEVAMKKFLIIFFLVFALDMGVNYYVLKVNTVDVSAGECLDTAEGFGHCLGRKFDPENSDVKSKQSVLKNKWMVMIIKDVVLVVLSLFFLGLFSKKKFLRSLKGKRKVLMLMLYLLFWVNFIFSLNEISSFIKGIEIPGPKDQNPLAILEYVRLIKMHSKIESLFKKDIALQLISFLYFLQYFRIRGKEKINEEIIEV